MSDKNVYNEWKLEDQEWWQRYSAMVHQTNSQTIINNLTSYTGSGSGYFSLSSGLFGSGFYGSGYVGSGSYGSGYLGSGFYGSGYLGSNFYGSGLLGSGSYGSGSVMSAPAHTIPTSNLYFQHMDQVYFPAYLRAKEETKSGSENGVLSYGLGLI